MPTNYIDTIQLGRKAQIFVKKEDIPGTIQYPVVADLIVPSGMGEFNQVPSYTDSTEIRDSRSLYDRFQDQNPAGSWNLPMYCRPSGTAGTKPDGDVLLEAAFGKGESLSTPDRYVYSLVNTDHITMSIFFAYQDMIFAILGATANEFKTNLVNKGAVNFNFAGGFMTALWAGKAEIASAATDTVTFSTEADTQKFRPGMKIQFYDVSATTWFSNTNAGYLIEAVNESAKTLTIDPDVSEFTPDALDLVQGWLPTGVEAGDPIAARTGTVEFDTPVVKLLSVDYTLNNNFSYMEDEISTEDYPTAFVADKRSVTAACSIYLRTDDLPYFRKGQKQTKVVLVMKAGDTAGSMIELKIKNAVGNVPAVSGDIQKQLAIEFKGLATDAATPEDETELKFI